MHVSLVLCFEVLTPLSFTSADVTMSVRKLLKRIILSRHVENVKDDTSENASAFAMQQLYNYTHGLSSDPMAMFAMTFSALIHDA